MSYKVDAWRTSIEMAAQEKDHGKRGDEGELKFLRSKGPDPLWMSGKECLSGVRKSQVSFFANEYKSWSIRFNVNVRAWVAESILN